MTEKERDEEMASMRRTIDANLGGTITSVYAEIMYKRIVEDSETIKRFKNRERT